MRNFRKEYIQLLNDHGVKFDEKYLFLDVKYPSGFFFFQSFIATSCTYAYSA